MWFTTVTVQRPEGTTMTDSTGRNVVHLPVKVDASKGSLVEAIIQAQLPKFRVAIKFKIYVDWQPNAILQQEDVLIDEQFIDPATTTNYKYKVVERPVNYVNDHQELEVETVVGTN